MIGIYKITSPTGRVYVGQSVDIEKRWKQHCSLYNKETSALTNSLKKHGVENHTFQVIEECSIDMLNERERYWQDYYDCVESGLNCKYTSTNDKTGSLSDETSKKISLSKKGTKLSIESVLSIKKRMNTNHPMKGRKHSSESLLKMSESHKGLKMSESSKEKRRITISKRCPVYDILCRTNLSESLKNVNRTKHWKDKISIANTGKTKSDKTKMKISKSLLGKLTGSLNGMSKTILDLETGIYYESISEYVKTFKISYNCYYKKFKNKRCVLV
jgi:group I intron endonuclease